MSHTATGYGVSEVTAPTAEPLQVSEVRRHLALDDSYYDDYLSGLIEVTRAKVQAHTHRQLVTATYDVKLDSLPAGQQTLALPYGSLQSVTSITYTDTAGPPIAKPGPLPECSRKQPQYVSFVATGQPAQYPRPLSRPCCY